MFTTDHRTTASRRLTEPPVTRPKNTLAPPSQNRHNYHTSPHLSQNSQTTTSTHDACTMPPRSGRGPTIFMDQRATNPTTDHGLLTTNGPTLVTAHPTSYHARLSLSHPIGVFHVDRSDLRTLFSQVFPDATASSPLIEVQAPGRVNLIGEHTDYNDGFVCPMAIDRHTNVLCRARADATVRVHSAASKETAEFSIAHEVPKQAGAGGGGGWSLYPRGIAEALRRKGLLKHGMDALITSTVPLGGGLSSSAALEIATGLALLKINHTEMEDVDLALAGQWAEHNYPGMPCGIMDQFISTMGRKGHAMLLDCRDRTFRHVPLDDPKLRIVISNTNVKHELVMGEYSARRHQCESAVAFVRRKFPKVRSLREVTMNDLEDARLGMDPTVFRRAKHVITEIQRTTDFAAALEAHDYKKCGELMYGSHASLRDDYAVSCRELDVLVEIARTVPGVYGARMTGGGFGGCIVALTTAEAVEPLTAKIDLEYPKFANKKATTFSTVASEGAHIVI